MAECYWTTFCANFDFCLKLYNSVYEESDTP